MSLIVCLIIRMKKFHLKSTEEKLKKISFSMALFYQLQFEAGYQPFLHLYTYTAVHSGRLKTTCDHQQFLRSLTTWQPGSG